MRSTLWTRGKVLVADVETGTNNCSSWNIFLNILQELLKTKKSEYQIITIIVCCVSGMRKSAMITEWWHHKAIIGILFSSYISC